MFLSDSDGFAFVGRIMGSVGCSTASCGGSRKSRNAVTDDSSGRSERRKVGVLSKMHAPASISLYLRVNTRHCPISASCGLFGTRTCVKKIPRRVGAQAGRMCTVLLGEFRLGEFGGAGVVDLWGGSGRAVREIDGWRRGGQGLE